MRGLPEYGMAKFMLTLPRIPILILTTQEYPLLQIEIWPELGTLSSHYPRIPPLPQKLKFNQNLVL